MRQGSFAFAWPKASFTFVLVTGADISGTLQRNLPPFLLLPTSMANGLFQVVSVASGFCLGKKFCTLMSRTAGGIRVGGWGSARMGQDSGPTKTLLRGLSRRSRESHVPHLTSHFPFQRKYFDVLLMSGGLLRLRFSTVWFGLVWSFFPHFFWGTLNLVNDHHTPFGAKPVHRTSTRVVIPLTLIGRIRESQFESKSVSAFPTFFLVFCFFCFVPNA